MAHHTLWARPVVSSCVAEFQAQHYLRETTQDREVCAVQHPSDCNCSAVLLHMQYSESVCMLRVHRICVLWNSSFFKWVGLKTCTEIAVPAGHMTWAMIALQSSSACSMAKSRPNNFPYQENLVWMVYSVCYFC